MYSRIQCLVEYGHGHTIISQLFLLTSFIPRIVGDVLAAVQALAEKVGPLAELASMQLEESKTMVLSNISSGVYHEVTTALSVGIVTAEWIQKPSHLSDENMKKFTWRDSKEDNSDNRRRYMKFLRDNIVWPAGHAVTDCHGSKELLNTVLHLEDGKHKTSGNIDVVVATGANVEGNSIRHNIRAGIELKKVSNKDINKNRDERQVVMQHVAASVLNRKDNVLTVLTDLNDKWVFYWFGQTRGILYKYPVCNRGEAKFLFEHMFGIPVENVAIKEVSQRNKKKRGKKGKASGASTPPIDTSMFPTDFLVRGTWRVFNGWDLATIGESHTEGSDGHDQGLPDPGPGGSGRPSKPEGSHRGKTDGSKTDGSKGGIVQGRQVAGNNYGMAVANELDLLDFVDEEEKGAIEFSYFVERVLPRMTNDSGQNTEGEGYSGLSEANLSIYNVFK